MIFARVGTHNAPFDRLVRWMDDIACQIEEPVVAQIGAATFRPEHCQHFRFCTSEEMRQWIHRARVVVTHGGASVREIVGAKRPAIIVPRLKRFGEVSDDHQLELAQVLARRGAITLVMTEVELEAALHAPSLPIGQLQSPESLIRAVREAIEHLG